jgi:tRNA 5-methylaminomethyl-2-thiouridine biosynthesis bifunctional protein
MRRAGEPWQPVAAAALEWRGGDPHSLCFDDLYYARENGLAESCHVFLQGNDLPARWAEHPHPCFRIAETGFGTGLNFLLTWHLWQQSPQRPDLHYLSAEKFPLQREDLARALAPWRELAPLATALLERYPGLVPGQHRLLLAGGRITLDLWWEDAAHTLGDLACRGAVVDAWYLDGFAPARNEAMWRGEMFRSMAAASRPGARLATFTAAGQVRRGLAGAGFEVVKVPGYGRKRECLRGRWPGPAPAPAAAAAAAVDTPWDLPAARATAPAAALVLGGGLAGCCAAAALARRGIGVTLLERETVAGAGSGNDQGVLYTRLSRRHSPLTDFALQSFRFAAQLYRELLQAGVLVEGRDGALCGSFHRCRDRSEMAALATALAAVPELAQVVDRVRAGELLGVSQETAGYWFPRSGWLHPPAVCRALLCDANIAVMERCGEVTLEPGGSGWRAVAGGRTLAEAPCAVVATGNRATSSSGLDWLPLRAIRGQTTRLPATASTRALRAVLCHDGYVPPARQGSHWIGATFDLQDWESAPRAEDNRRNLAALAAAVPPWREALAALDPARLAGRVGFRCASPDYLPLVGPVPEREEFLRSYAPLRRNARQRIERRGPYIPGLFLSTAHGARGLTSAPLAGELLASQICNEPLPLDRGLCRALSPARFLVRDLARNRI